MTDKIHAVKLLAAETGAANANLPVTYAQARNALADCQAVDECKTWADKAAALASYARQANDNELLKMATRIRDRAIRRAGELLVEVEPQPGARTDREPSVGATTRFTVAKGAGMSRGQAVTAIRVARIADEDFERQVESDSPPTVTALARQGRRSLKSTVRHDEPTATPAAKRKLERRLERFEHAFSMIMFNCECAAEIAIPPLSAERSAAAVKQIAKARRHLGELKRRLEENVAP